MFPLFGANWYLSSALYAGTLLAFLFSVVAVTGRFELDAKGSQSHANCKNDKIRKAVLVFRFF
jgi:hypothetical protein